MVPSEGCISCKKWGQIEHFLIWELGDSIAGRFKNDFDLWPRYWKFSTAKNDVVTGCWRYADVHYRPSMRTCFQTFIPEKWTKRYHSFGFYKCPAIFTIFAQKISSCFSSVLWKVYFLQYRIRVRILFWVYNPVLLGMVLSEGCISCRKWGQIGYFLSCKLGDSIAGRFKNDFDLLFIDWKFSTAKNDVVTGCWRCPDVLYWSVLIYDPDIGIFQQQKIML